MIVFSVSILSSTFSDVVPLPHLVNFITQNFDFSMIDESFIVSVVIFLLAIFSFLFTLEITLILLWKIFYGRHRGKKLNAFAHELAGRRPYTAIHNDTGQKHQFFAIDKKHAESILSKTGASWTIMEEQFNE